MSTSSSPATALITQVISAWQLQNRRVNNIINKLTAEEFYQETAPGRNSGIYLLGHLIAVNDTMLPLLGLGERLYPELDEPFVHRPDRSGQQFPAPEILKGYWQHLNDILTMHFTTLTPDQWLTKHNAISEADFADHPQRNKLNVLLGRIVHQAYHSGQLTFLL
ncbi:DinB family protein [uncultured Chitinophaga sp.]|uniref:DinB family protein n=1 Tax=uncultured Chitinophaga sp. TaxID=339340 RepID=UPI002612B4CD|nr:DinB family protein [uncultured Chitinophaga sp.]